MICIPIIEHERCTRCGRCVDICPKRVITLRDGSIAITEEECMLCSHCYAVCPSDAIRFDPEVLIHPALPRRGSRQPLAT